MKKAHDFDDPGTLVSEILRRLPRKKPITRRKLVEQFQKLYGKRCAQWMVSRGIVSLTDQAFPGWRAAARAFVAKLARKRK